MSLEKRAIFFELPIFPSKKWDDAFEISKNIAKNAHRP